MILECPNCDTRYEIPGDLPPEGRKVRCASCQHVWTATVENQPKAEATPDIFDDGEIVFKNEDEMSETPPADEDNSQDSIDDMFSQGEEEPEEEAGNSQDSVDDMFAQGEKEPEEEAGNSQDSVDDMFAQGEKEPEEEAGNSQDSVDDMFSQAEEEPEEEAGNSQDSVDDMFAQPEKEPETAPSDATVKTNDGDIADAVATDEAAPDDGAENDFSESAMEEAFSSAVQEAGEGDTEFPVEETQEVESSPIIIGKAKKRRHFVPGSIAAGWAALAIMLGGVTSYVYYGRINVVRVLPGAAATYERLGLPVNVRGLEFEKIKYSWETSSGRSILEVYGDIVNVTSEPLKVPTVVFGLRTKEKVEVYQWAADVRSELLPGGQRTAFSAQIPTPPKSIRDVLVRFAKVR